MKDTRTTERVLTIFLSLILIFSLTACAGETAGGNTSGGDTGAPAGSAREPASGGASQAREDEAAPSGSPEELGGTSEEESDDASGSGILIVYFSHTGENHNVGVIEKGNTHIIADMIAEETGADLFEIVTAEPYPDTYDECTDVAKREQKENARPEIVDPPEDLDGYDTVFIGYPIWWGDLPMAVYTFLESYDFSGKTVVPFCTHEGSGLSGTESSIEETCSGATVLDGLAIRGATAQDEQEEAKSDVLDWLGELGF